MKDNVFGPRNATESVTLSSEEAALAHSLLAKLLAGNKGREGEGGEEAAETEVMVAAHEDVLTLARAVYQSRKRRIEHFGQSLFSEPAWDMLLVLFIYGDRGDQVSVTKLAEFSNSPLTTSIRWLDYLESQKLVVRTQSSHDRRKNYVELSEKGRRLLTEYFRSLIEGGTAISGIGV
ncbi:hypothetical protein GCM10022280_23210 [Sphingomonas swuensis]|uniref:HTH marR-type domain-containing protein n=1 Tax=Sphingomonas swuensis TaxID=977800 RepID=A0ABP7T776_9SPHN